MASVLWMELTAEELRSKAAQDAVGTLATVLSVVLVVLPVGWLLLRWLPWRLGWLREARAAERLLAGTPDLDLLAARAVATAPLLDLGCDLAQGFLFARPASAAEVASSSLSERPIAMRIQKYWGTSSGSLLRALMP
mgnify:CR=1 FL=1